MDDWQAQQWQDECDRIRETIEALEAAEKAGTPREFLIVLAHEAGVGQIYKGSHEAHR